MTCTVQFNEKPELNNPILIEGLPGIGFVANIANLHLIQELKAKLFAEIRSSSFQDFAMTAGDGKARFPTNELYYHKGRDNQERDLIILYGNTQALTTVGQYELCGKVLDISEELGCNYIVTLGGLRREEKIPEAKLYCAASDPEVLKEALNLGAEIIEGQIFGIAGLLVGLCKLWNMKGFCLLAETPGTFPDRIAAKELLKTISSILMPKLDLNDLTETAEFANILAPFDFGALAKKRIEETKPGWFI